MALPQHKNPCPGGHKIYNFGRLILGHHFFTLSLSDLCLFVKKIFIEILHFYYMPTPQHKNPCSGGHKIHNFVRPSLGHKQNLLNLSDLCLRIEKKLNKKMHFHYKTYVYMATPRSTIFVDTSLVTITMHLVCLIIYLNHASEQRGRFLKT